MRSQIKSTNRVLACHWIEQAAAPDGVCRSFQLDMREHELAIRDC